MNTLESIKIIKEKIVIKNNKKDFTELVKANYIIQQYP